MPTFANSWGLCRDAKHTAAATYQHIALQTTPDVVGAIIILGHLWHLVCVTIFLATEITPTLLFMPQLARTNKCVGGCDECVGGRDECVGGRDECAGCRDDCVGCPFNDLDVFVNPQYTNVLHIM